MRRVPRMILGKLIAQLETSRAELAAAEAEVKRLEREIAVELHLTGGGRRSQKSTMGFTARNRVLPPAQRTIRDKRILELSAQGKKPNEIARELGTTSSVVYIARAAHNKKLGKPMKFGPAIKLVPLELAEKIQAGMKAGHSQRQIQRETGASRIDYEKVRDAMKS